MKVNPYLNFNGQCEEAIKFYEKATGGKIVAIMPYSGTPAATHVPADWQNKVMHACLDINGTYLMASDVPPQLFQKPQGFSVSLNFEKPADADRVFNALGEGGNVTMPIAKTFWAERFGAVTDRYGIPWMINCEKGA